MLRLLLSSCLLLLVLTGTAHASIYLYLDAKGHKGATDRREAVPPGAKVTSVIDLGNEPPSPAKSFPARKPTRRVESPGNFPRIDSGTQKKRDNVRRTILEDELASERKELEQARKIRQASEKPMAGENTQSPTYQTRIKQLQDNVLNHERNIEAIQRELDR